MKEKTISILSMEEVQGINAGTIKLDAALFAHRKNLSVIIDALTEEKKAIDAAILEKVEHKKVKNELFYTVISDFCEFNAEEFKKTYGEEVYNQFKTRPVHRESVRTK